MTVEPHDLARQYVQVWNEPDPVQRAERVATLWAPHGTHHSATLSVTGHADITARIAAAHERFVRQDGGVFRLHGAALEGAHRVSVRWAMTDSQGTATVFSGSDILVLTSDGRISRDEQVIDLTPRAWGDR